MSGSISFNPVYDPVTFTTPNGTLETLQIAQGLAPDVQSLVTNLITDLSGSVNFDLSNNVGTQASILVPLSITSNPTIGGTPDLVDSYVTGDENVTVNYQSSLPGSSWDGIIVADQNLTGTLPAYTTLNNFGGTNDINPNGYLIAAAGSDIVDNLTMSSAGTQQIFLDGYQAALNLSGTGADVTVATGGNLINISPSTVALGAMPMGSSLNTITTEAAPINISQDILNLDGGATTVYSAGNDTINVVSSGNGNGYDNVVSVTGNSTVNIATTSVDDKVTLAGSDVASVAGTSNTIVLTGSGATSLTVSGAGNTIYSSDSAATITYVGAAIGTVTQTPPSATTSGSGSVPSSASLLYLGSGSSTVISGGDNVVSLGGGNAVSVTGGADTIPAFAGTDTITATGNASIRSYDSSGYAGKISFINNSSAAATLIDNQGSVTMAGGAGGGTVTGGTGGNNSIIGGTGAIFATGGGDQSLVVANSAQTNYMYAGFGNETLIATSSTGTNLFDGNPGSGGDVMQSDGSGTQYFFGSAGSATVTGSTVAGSSNVFFEGSSVLGGASVVVTNFGQINGAIDANSGVTVQQVADTIYAGMSGALVTLTDGTRVTLLGVQASSLSYTVGGNSVT